MKFEDIVAALKTLNIDPPISIVELKERYRKLIKEAKLEELQKINEAYKTLIDLMENYPFMMDKREFLLAFPEERLKERFFGDVKK